MEIFQISKEELNEAIEFAVLRALTKYEEHTNSVLISRAETAARLHVDLTTLWRWEKAGIFLPKTRMGGRTYYSLEEVLKRERGEITV